VQPKITGSAAVSTTDPQATQSQPNTGTYAAEQRYRDLHRHHKHSQPCDCVPIIQPAHLAACHCDCHAASWTPPNLHLVLSTACCLRADDPRQAIVFYLTNGMHAIMFCGGKHVCRVQAPWVWPTPAHSLSGCIQPATPSWRPNGCPAASSHGLGQWLES